jgi:hypothetical protein
MSIKLATNKKDTDIIRKIAERALSIDMFAHADRVELMIDIAICHCNGTPLDLQKLLDADDLDFIYDVARIRRHISYKTGKLCGHFSPRCSLPSSGERRAT